MALGVIHDRSATNDLMMPRNVPVDLDTTKGRTPGYNTTVNEYFEATHVTVCVFRQAACFCKYFAHAKWHQRIGLSARPMLALDEAGSTGTRNSGALVA